MRNSVINYLLLFAFLLVSCNKEDVYTASYKFVIEGVQEEIAAAYEEGDYIDIKVSVIDYNYKEPLHTEPQSYGRKEDTKAKLVYENSEWVLYSEQDNWNLRKTAISVVAHHLDNCTVDIYTDYPPHPIGAGERRHMPFSTGEQEVIISLPK